ncbi:FHA modulated ABC efflux pump with fused ATPase and integral membrane subunits [Oscillatoria nigro-viridis PCC 7112]|uniref:FHA modulated ABC efflux pump with fused ATPase and integral membrane subunits n=1 Tax=Phormidium nigroviride PCC 7112 TaxID=179408 RepID=K9VC40_9CYAN|nr:FHA domain-containing protein [Oscillatoria nigro-viridis]AFZ05491.1 FHA modulated ABC efflux pump with fused ATPase and integral membrane subunits [Oscillatoria nigro-viridis PCC 7112]
MTGNIGQLTALSDRPYIVLSNQGEVLQLELKQQQHVLGRDRTRADLVIPEAWRAVSNIHAVLRQIGDNYWIYDGDGQRPSTNGLFVDRTRITPNDGYCLKDGTEIKIGLDPQNQVLLTYFNPLANQVAVPSKQSILLKNRSVLLGRDPNASLQLDAPLVSRRHATIDQDSRGNYILRDYSVNGVFVNGQRVTNSVQLSEGDAIRIGPFTLTYRSGELQMQDSGHQIRLDADSLVIPKRLDNITLAIEPGQFVALVGGSGAGKSTLMRTLLGIEKTTNGAVFLNGDNLRQNFNIYRNQIGYVPQDDIVHADLTVQEVLSYAAKLRLPPDTDVNQVVAKTLEDIEMTHRRKALVKQLSGGQRKRVSIGVELLADPKLFFLDEPTSGLDPGLDKKMMQLLRKLANQGRTVILVTHATANITMCDRIVFMGRGGRLCYFGPPAEALDFFDVKTGDFADIYNELETGETNVQSWAEKFNKSPYYQRYIVNHFSTGNANRKTPSAPSVPKSQSFVKQLVLLAQRYFQLISRDVVNLSLALLTAPIGISLLRLAVRDKDPLIGAPEATLAPLALRVLFVFTCAAIWVGLATSLQEIVKESAIYLRERLVNLGLFAYLGSKFFILSGLAVLQTLLMVGVILSAFKSPEPSFISWPVGASITTFLTLMSCISLGLLVSAIVKNGSQANSALPLLLLPQIIFSGVLFKMEGAASKFSWLMLSRWSVGAYGSLVNVNGMVPAPTALPDGSTLPLPFEPTPVYDPTWENLGLNWGILFVHIFVYLMLTLWLQKRKDIL